MYRCLHLAIVNEVQNYVSELIPSTSPRNCMVFDRQPSYNRYFAFTANSVHTKVIRTERLISRPLQYVVCTPSHPLSYTNVLADKNEPPPSVFCGLVLKRWLFNDGAIHSKGIQPHRSQVLKSTYRNRMIFHLSGS